jgi:hypothetical protein
MISWFETSNPSTTEVTEAISGALKMSRVQGMLMADTLANVEQYVPSSLVASALPELRVAISDPVALGWLEIYADPVRHAACKAQSPAE